MMRWEAGISAPRDGRVILAAWNTLAEGRRAWRYALVAWDGLQEAWFVQCEAVGVALKRAPSTRSGRRNNDPRGLKWTTQPEVWADIDQPPDASERGME